jgi:hypothetical protein
LRAIGVVRGIASVNATLSEKVPLQGKVCGGRRSHVMKKSPFSQEQIIEVLQEAEAGVKVLDVCPRLRQFAPKNGGFSGGAPNNHAGFSAVLANPLVVARR